MAWSEASDWASAIFFVICTVIGYFVYERYKLMNIFRKLGVPGPPPNLFTGNNAEIRPASSFSLQCYKGWQQQYGKIFGYNRSGTPVLVISDLDMLKQIIIKDFHIFTNRGKMRVTLKAHHDSLLGLRGERWREVRKTLNPTFTTSKMKQLALIVNKKVSMFESAIDKMAAGTKRDVGDKMSVMEPDGGFDIYEKFQRMTLDVIGECALAMKIDCQREINNPTFDGVRQFMSGNYGAIGFMLSNFAFLDLLLRWWISRLPMMTMATEVTTNLYRAIAMRRRAASEAGRSSNTIDMLQLMLNTTTTEKPTGNEKKETTAPVGDGLTNSRAVALTDDELVGNCWAILIAGYETTSTALAYVAHQLTVHPEIQQKVYEEIIEKTSPDQIPTYEEAHSLQYLDQVINETLRLYPPVVLFMTRECAQDYDLNGIKIPAGMKIEIPIYSIHHDPELWPDPEKFDPERFSPENKSKIHPMAHIPFGAGPRNCIGMRFALLEAKLTLIRLIRKYRLEPCDKTKDPPEVTVPHATFVPKNGIYLKVVPRDY